MKRREERKRARNALIEETTRLEASNAVSDTFQFLLLILLNGNTFNY